MVVKPSPNSAVLDVFSTHFPPEATKCQCNNASLQFALAEQIHDA